MTDLLCSRIYRDNDGSTLVEILAVLAIVASAAFVVISYGGSPRAKGTSRDFARTIAAAAAQTALRAVSSGTTQTLDIFAESGRIEGTAFASPIAAPPGVKIGVTFASEFTGDGGRASIAFFPDRASSGGEIRVTDRTGRAFAIRTHWLTGIVTTEELK